MLKLRIKIKRKQNIYQSGTVFLNTQLTSVLTATTYMCTNKALILKLAGEKTKGNPFKNRVKLFYH